MKKLLILMALMVLMTTMALGYVEPTYTLIDNEVIDTEIVCDGYNGDIYCLAEGGATDYLLKYEVGTGTLSTVNTYGQVGTVYNGACKEYSGSLYCQGFNGDYSNTLKFDLTTGVMTNLTEYDYGATYYGSGSSCDFKEGTDELWCFGWTDSTGLQKIPVRYYDVSEDTWTTYSVFDYAPDFTRISYTECEFRPDYPDELWCAGGYLTSVASNFIIKVDTLLNTTTTYNITPYIIEASQGKWVQDEFYVIGGDDGSNPVNTSIVFHPSNGTYTSLQVMPEAIGNWYGCGEVDAYNDVCLPVYDLAWGYPTYIYEVNYGVPPCVEDWQPYYTACDVTDNMTLYYLDLNECGTFDNLPPDNDTLEVCNYCDPTWEETSLDCVAGDSERDITYEYTNTCCADTGLPTDCTIPADTTESCIGLHESSDVPNVVIDFLVEYGREMVGLAGLIAVFGLGIWAYSMYRKR